MPGTEKPLEIYQETTAPMGNSDIEEDKDLKQIDTIHGDEAVKGLSHPPLDRERS
jgi:hypothetical protein